QEALQDAHEVAAHHENQEITPLHLLAALVNQADGVVPPLLARLGIRRETMNSEVERELGRLPKVQGFSEQRMSRALNDALECAGHSGSLRKIRKRHMKRWTNTHAT